MDPRRRLQVLNQANPPLRVAAAPKQPRLTVGVAKQQPLYINTGKEIQRIEQSPTARTSSVAERRNLSRVSNNVNDGGFGLDDVARTIFPATARAVNTVGEGIFDTPDTLRAITARLTGNQAAEDAAVRRASSNRFLDEGSGLGGVGGIFDNETMQGAISPDDFTRRVVGTAMGVFGEAAPLSANSFVKGGSLARRALTEAGIGAGLAGTGSIGDQLVTDGSIDLGRTGLSTLAGGAIGGSIPLIGRLFNKVHPTAKSVGLKNSELKALKNSDDAADIAGILANKFGQGVEEVAELAEQIAHSKSTREIVNILRHTPLEAAGPAAAGALVAAAAGRGRQQASQQAAEGLTEQLQQPVPLPERWIGPGDPPEGWAPGSVPLSPTGNEQAYNEALRNAGEMLGDDSLIRQAEENLRFSPVKENSKEVVKDAKNAKAVVRGAESDTSDTLSTAISALAKSPNKSEVRSIVEGLFRDSKLDSSVVGGNDLNKLVKDLTKETDKGKVTQRLSDELAKVKDRNTAPATAEELPTVEGVPTQEELATATPNQGAVATEIAPNGAKDAKAPETAPTATNVAETVNKNFDEAIAETRKALKDASTSYKDATKLRAKEKAARIAKADAAYRAAGGGPEGMRAKMAALKGEYAKSSYVGAGVSQDTKKMFLDDIQELVDLKSIQGWEGFNLQRAFEKVWGDLDEKPAKHDINYIRKYLNSKQDGLGDEIAEDIKEAVEAGGKDWQEHLVEYAGVPRTAMASFDLSMGGRQGLPVAARSSKEWANANYESVKYVKSTKYFESEMKKIADDPDYELMIDKMNLRMPAVAGEADEQMNAAGLLEKIPVYGKGIEASDRAYSGGLSKLRYNIAKTWITALRREGKLDDLSDKDLTDIGEVINTFTGTGGKKGGFTDRHMTTLSTTLFAPRLWAGNLNRLNPYFYARLSPGKPTNPFEATFGAPGSARRRALEYQSSFMTLVGSVLGIASAAGATVVMDPRSSDFGKIKVGNTRYDIMGGQQQNIVLLAREITGQKTSSTTGETSEVGEGFGASTRFDLAIDAIANKFNPLLGTAKRVMEMKTDEDGNTTDKFGGQTSLVKELSNLGIPLNVQAIRETNEDTGNLGKSIAMNLPSFVGFGAQTYGPEKTKDKDKGPSTVADTLAQADKDREQSLEEFKNNLSDDEQALIGKSEKSLNELVDDGTIDEKMRDRILTLKQARENLDGIELPDGLKNDATKGFYRRYNMMTEKGQDKYLSGEPDEHARAIASALNKQLPKGLSKIKPSNKISKLFADFEVKQSTENWSQLDEREKRRELWRDIAKAGQPEAVNDVFASTIGDLETLIDEGKITKEALSEAIKLDNELVASGLSGRAHFSKSFRDRYGYAYAPGSGGSGGRGGSRSSTKEVRAHLAAFLLPDSIGNSKASIPTFSRKPRQIRFRGAGLAPGAPRSGRKININL